MFKKITSMMMALVMCLALCIPAFAAEGENVNSLGSNGMVTYETKKARVHSLASCAHEPTGPYLSTEWRVSDKFNPDRYCKYEEEYANSMCKKCATPFIHKTGNSISVLHDKVYTTNETGVIKGFYCKNCNYKSWKAIPDEIA